MSGISGWAGYRDDHVDNKTLIEEMGESLTCFDGSTLHVVTGENAALCAAGTGARTDCCRMNGMLAAIHGVYRWGDTRLAEAADRNGAASALIEGYLAKGDKVLDSIRGHFSVVLIKDGRGEVLLATDRVASEPLIYAVSGQSIVFASTSDALQKHPAVANDIDPQAIFNYLYFHVVPGPGSIYKAQQKMLPGSCVHFKNGALESTAYWRVDYQEDSGSAGFDELKEEFLEILRSSVENAAQGGEKTGAFLSGGTDSSTVTGMLSETLKTDVPTYSIGFAAEGYDEMEYARIAAGRFHADHHEYYITPEDIVDSVPRIARIYDEPFGNSSAVPTYYCAKLARDDGVTRLLAGDGGDELFAGNPHYARQYIFSIYDMLPGFLRKQLIEPVVMSSMYPRVTMPLKKIQRYVEQAMVPMPARLETYNLLKCLGIENVIEPAFLEQVDPEGPNTLMSSHYYNTNARTMLNRMLWFDYKFVLADKDLPKVSRMCELAGLEVAYPLLSEELIMFSARLPPKLKLKGQYLRYFFKEALRDFLPAEIISKEKHGFGLPVGIWMARNKDLGQLAKDSLNDLKARKIVRSDLIDSLLDTRLEEHAPYYGTMVWILMMLEQWFKQHH